MSLNKKYTKPKWAEHSVGSKKLVAKSIELRTNDLLVFKNFIITIFTIIAIGIGLFIVMSEWDSNDVIMGPISVPEEMAKAGYNETVISNILLDKAQEFQLETDQLSASATWHNEIKNVLNIDTLGSRPNITIPEINISLQPTLIFIKKSLGKKFAYLQGNIVKNGSDLILVLRDNSNVNLQAKYIHGKEDQIEKMLKDGAKELIRLTNPIVLTIYDYHKSSNNAKQGKVDYSEFDMDFDFCLKECNEGMLPLAYVLKGNELIDLKKYQDATYYLEKAEKLRPDFGFVFNSLGNILFSENKLDEALENYKKAFDYFDRNNMLESKGYSLANIGGAFRLKHQPYDAIKYFQMATKINPDDTDAYNDWGNALLDLKCPAEAIDTYKIVINIDQNDEDAYTNIGRSYINLNKSKEAINSFKAAINKNKLNYDAYIYWGEALINTSHADEAEKLFKKAIEINPDNSDGYSYWGKALIKKGMPLEAIDKLNHAAALDSFNVDIYNNLGSAYLSIGQTENAIAEYNKAIAKNKFDNNAYIAIGNSLVKLKQFEDAMNQFKFAINNNPFDQNTYAAIINALNSIDPSNEAYAKFKNLASIAESNNKPVDCSKLKPTVIVNDQIK